MKRLLLLTFLLTALCVAGCRGEARSTNRDKDMPEPPPSAKK